ncbi:MAG TPA: Rieske 2Fe-2S domain-containing protein [Acidimicrobiales bacterium]|nr:Rieske 2Fe-2S domain-containing protein [Acidimicrobiales bacterium]
MIIAIAIIALVVLAGVVVIATARRRDTAAATGALSRETLRRDRSSEVPAGFSTPADDRPTGREVERAAALERSGRAVVVAPTPAAPAPYIPPDDDAIGVSRRQFLNRGIVNMFALGLGGFGGEVNIPASLGEILDYYSSNKEPYYFAPGRVYMVPYPEASLDKAGAVYEGGVLEGMEAGIVALYQKCVHLGCRVPWCKTSQWFECPCHGSQYNRVGEKKGGPAPRGLDRFPVKIDGARVTVDTGLVVNGPPIGTNTTGQEAEGPHCVGGGGSH